MNAAEHAAAIPAPPRLLIAACSQRKRADEGLLPAIERYDGPVYRVLRRFLRQHPSKPPGIYITILSTCLSSDRLSNNGLVPGTSAW
jgi:hypothetical protein